MAFSRTFRVVGFSVFASVLAATCGGLRYEPTWRSLDSRPLPSWYDEAKLGIFLHWGVFSVPSYGSEWFWFYWKAKAIPRYVSFMERNFRPDFTYADFASMFTAEFFDPEEWADIFKASGARYVVLTSKHHEGFTNWPSQVSWNWNSYDTGPHRDLVGDLANAIRKRTDIKFGIYHSLFEWFNPVYLKDVANNFTTQDFVTRKSMPELYELVNKYRPEVIWSDGSAGPDYYWNSTNFLAWLYNESPVRDTVVTNDRWGSNGIVCHHGGYYTCTDRYNPGTVQKHKWENAMTIDRNSWGYRREAKLSDFLSTANLIQTLAETVSCGGNMLVNVGPTHDGKIAPVFEERLRQLGQWLSVNGEAIYSSQPWSHQRDNITKNVWYTTKKTTKGWAVYAVVLQWPKQQFLTLSAPKPSTTTTVTMLGLEGRLKWWQDLTGALVVSFPVTKKLPCQWAWVLKFDNLVY